MLSRAQLNAYAEQARAAEAEAQTLSLSMAAHYGEDWVAHSKEVAHRLATDPAVQADWERARDAQERLELLDREFQAVKSRPSRRWAEIQNAPTNNLGL